MIDKARWPVDSFQNLHLEDVIQISVPSSDKELLAWLIKNQNAELSVEREKKKKTYSVILSFRLLKFRHLVENGQANMDSMAQIIPTNRSVEQVLIYILDSDKADPRFKNIIRKVTN